MTFRIRLSAYGVPVKSQFIDSRTISQASGISLIVEDALPAVNMHSPVLVRLELSSFSRLHSIFESEEYEDTLLQSFRLK